MNKICAVSKFAMKGFDQILKDGEDLLVADSDNEFVGHLDHILTGIASYSKMAAHGHQKILEHYSREEISRILRKTLN